MLLNIFLTPSFIILFLLNPLKNIQKEFVDVKVYNKVYKTEVANTVYKQAVGLMFRDFKETGLMIFPYSKPVRPTYYNKNVRFPIRIYFLDSSMIVKSTFIMKKNSYKNYSPDVKINYVLEVPLLEDLSNDPGNNPSISAVLK